MVFEYGPGYDYQWSAIISISSKIGYTAETLRRRVRRAEIDSGKRGGMTRDERGLAGIAFVAQRSGPGCPGAGFVFPSSYRELDPSP